MAAVTAAAVAAAIQGGADYLKAHPERWEQGTLIRLRDPKNHDVLSYEFVDVNHIFGANADLVRDGVCGLVNRGVAEVCGCALGAITFAKEDEPLLSYPAFWSKNRDLGCAVQDTLGAYVRDKVARPKGQSRAWYPNIENFNDNGTTTVHDVIRVLEQAASAVKYRKFPVSRES